MISIRDLHKAFGSHQVLCGINLEVPEAKTTVVLGGSGQGKSVLLKHIIGLLKADSGQILVENQDVVSISDIELIKLRKKFGMLFQDAALFDSMDVYENIAFPLREHTKLQENEIRQRVAEALKHVNLTGIESKWPNELSGGMRKRVGLARAIIHQPQYMLYDEPTTGLDPVTSSQINWLINNTKEQLNMTSVVISHDLESTRQIADRVAMLYQGKIIASGDVEEVFRSTHPVVKKFLSGESLDEVELAR